MNELFIPTLHTFAMNNPFTGSKGAFRFKITPDVTKIGKEAFYKFDRLETVDFGEALVEIGVGIGRSGHGGDLQWG